MYVLLPKSSLCCFSIFHAYPLLLYSLIRLNLGAQCAEMLSCRSAIESPCPIALRTAVHHSLCLALFLGYVRCLTLFKVKALVFNMPT
jgi:hypothetical protein